MTDRELMDMAREAAGKAYVPYSQFPVGAALECSDGTVFTGCNGENAAFGSTIGAERTALLKAVSEGHREDWEAIAIAGQGADYCWPCGACRQMLYEFAPDLTLLVAGKDHRFGKLTLRDPLPHGVGPKGLEGRAGDKE